MNPTISQAYIDQFSHEVRLVYQQMTSRLKSTITNDPLAAENGYFDFMGSIEAVERVGRSQEVQETPPDITRRKCTQRVFEASIWEDKFEKKIISSPMSQKCAMTIAAALKRKQDQQIVTAALGTAYGGRDGTTAIPFDTANQEIAANYNEDGTTTTQNITTGKIRFGIRKLTGAEALPDDNHSLVTVLYSSVQLQSMLRIAEELKVTGTTYESLMSGKPDVIFMGMRWIRVNDKILPYKTGTVRQVVMYGPDAINYCEVSDVSLEVNYIPNKKSWLISGDFQGDSARLRENGVVSVLCDESVI